MQATEKIMIAQLFNPQSYSLQCSRRVASFRQAVSYLHIFEFLIVEITSEITESYNRQTLCNAVIKPWSYVLGNSREACVNPDKRRRKMCQ